MNIRKTFTFSAIVVAMVAIMGSSVTRAALIDPLQNGDFEQVASADASAYDWQEYGTGYARVVGAGINGSAAVEVRNETQTSSSGAYQRIDLAQTSMTPVFIGAQVRGVNIAKLSGSYFGASLYAEIHLTNGQVAYWNTAANSGTFDWRWIGFSTANIPTLTAPIDHIFIVPSLINASGVAYFDDVTVQEFTPTQSAVTLLFDDGPRNTYGRARPVLERYTFKGTAAVITDYIGTPGYMTLSQINNLYWAGWEIMSHSATHSDLTTLTSAQVAQELSKSKAVLVNYGVKNFAYPYGAYNGDLNAQGMALYKSLRGFEQGSNAQGTYPYDVKVRGVTTQTTLADVRQYRFISGQFSRYFET
ncbi:MAG: polysaccharide deacetylase family protein [Candidatus Doudnabacteria bacterium]|nr:polysaccharide deacetylase family protein [Candidatus Doudnabacteria bacterium]